MRIDEKISLYAKLHDEICEYFGFKNPPLIQVWEDIGWWHCDGSYLYHGQGTVDDDIDSWRYSGGDVPRSFTVEKETHTFFNFDDGCGNQYGVIVPNVKMVTSPELIEKIEDYA